MLSEPIPYPKWQRFANCRATTYPEMFFSEKGGAAGKAKRMCQLCNVQAQCLAHALENRIEDGVWGGLGPKE
jgi:WhiB family redox-sensing transcriptional regulator